MIDIVSAPRKTLSDLVKQAADLRTVLDTAPSAEQELQRRAAEQAEASREKERLAKIASLRKREETAAIALATKVDEANVILSELATLRTNLRNLNAAPLTGTLSPSLAGALDGQLATVRRNHPEWLGLPKLPTRRELAIEDAQLQVAQAEKRLAHARQVRKDAPQQTQAHKDLIERAERSVKLAKDRLRIAKGVK